MSIENFFRSALGRAKSQIAPKLPYEFDQLDGTPPQDLLENTPYSVETPRNAMQFASPQRQKRSLIDTIGGISDVLARVGGADPLYQAGIDARRNSEIMQQNREFALQDRGFAQEDRTRDIEMDGLKLQQGQQQLSAGQEELDTASDARLGSVLRATQAIKANGGDINKALPLLLSQARINPERAAELVQAVAQNPQYLDALAEQQGGTGKGSLNYVQVRDAQGNLKFYQPTQNRGLVPIELPAGEQPAGTIGKVDVGGQEILYDGRTGRPLRSFAKSGAPVSGERAILDQKGQIVGYKAIPGSNLDYQRNAKADNQTPSRASSGSALTPTQFGLATQKLRTLPAIINHLNRLEKLSDQLSAGGTLARGYLGGMIPGQLAGGDAAKFDKASALLTSLLRPLTKVPGDGSVSNYDAQINALPLPSRGDTDESRKQAIQDFRILLKAKQQELSQNIGATRAPKRALPPRASTPVTRPARTTKPSISNW